MSCYRQPGSITLLDLTEHGFDVNHRRAVDGFDWTDPQAVLGNLAYSDLMKSDWIRSIRGSGGKHTCKPSTGVRAWMNLENISVRLV